MKKYLLGIVAVMTLCTPSASYAADIYGVWARDGHPTDKLEFYDCSGKLCAKGTLPGLDGTPPPIILRSAAKTGPNSWKGDLFNPEDGKTYTGKISFDSPTSMTMTGCLVAFLCQSETWTRVSGPTKPKAETKSEAKTEDASGTSPDAKTPQAKTEKPPGKSAEKPAKTAKPVEAKPAEAKSTEGKSTEARPAEAKPRARAKPVEEEAN